jgi:hypothetical protein
MKLSHKKLKKLINEALLTELFDSPPYPYNVKEMNVVSDAVAEELNGRMLQQDVLYEFETDPSDGDYGGEGFAYVVSFTLDMLSGGSMPWEDEPDPMDPNNFFWTVVFEAKEIGNPKSDYDVTQTHQSDMRALSTVAAIVNNFVTEVLPEIPDRDVKTFSFVGSPSHVFDVQKGHMITARGDEGQTRRTKIYLAMLKRKLPPGSEIIPTPPGGGHSAGSEENIIFFRMP